MELLVGCWINGRSLKVVMAVVMALLVLQVLVLQEVDAAGGQWRVVTKNSGISAMHAAVTPIVGSVVLLHHTNQGPSRITFPGGRCRQTTYDLILKNDCYAHSVILDPTSGVVRPLMILTDTQCSSAQFLADGSLYQTGGDVEGKKKIRTLSRDCYTVEPVTKKCDWVETNANLNVERWYSTNQLLPDGRQIIVGGRNTMTLEFVPPSSAGAITLALLNNAQLYPFVHLLPSGFLFIFVNLQSIIYDYKNNKVVRTFPNIPGNPRSYPYGGSSVMLPLKWEDDHQKAEIVVCGGAVSKNNKAAVCSNTCGRIEATKAGSTWAMETMPIPRCMGDMILLPDTNVLVINGAGKGFQGWLCASAPTKIPVLYEPQKAAGQRFSTMAGTGTARVYHSTANLITDGSVLVAGSNTHKFYDFTPVASDPTDIPTELSVESFMPPYASNLAGGRPVILSADGASVKYNQVLQIQFWDVPTPLPGTPDTDTFLFTLNSSPWSTHSFAHGQRMITLKSLGITNIPGGTTQNGVKVNLRTAQVQISQYNTVLPATFYMVWVVKNGNPSKSCMWIQIS